MKSKKVVRTLNTAIGISMAALAGAAIMDQLRRPREERTWQGQIAGMPYDFRPPTLAKIRNTFWNKETSRIFVPRAFGIGWDINFYPIIHPEATE